MIPPESPKSANGSGEPTGKRYQTPTLTIFGPVGMLTQSAMLSVGFDGSGGMWTKTA